MKMNILYRTRIMLALVLAWTFTSCQDDDIPGASYQPGAWFYARGAGSTITNDMAGFNKKFSGLHSFYFYPGVEVDTFALSEIRLMGMPVNYARKVNIVAGEGSTAVEGEDFKIVDNVLPANAVSFIPKVLLIKKNLGEEEKVIKFVLKPSDEFPALVLGDTVSDDRTFLISSRYELKFSKILVQPPYWAQCSRFGDWSRVKYEFMLEKLKKYWGLEPVSPSDMTEMYNDVLRMRYELQKWRTENGGVSMMDENGKEVRF